MTDSPLSGHLGALRSLMDAKALDAVLVPRGDEHLGEYVPPSAERLSWLTGFTGSAGLAVILKDKAALFVDGRYTLQASQQAPQAHYEIRPLTADGHIAYLREHLGRNRRVGFDPWLHSASAVQALKIELAQAGIEPVALNANPIDAIWNDRPAAPTARRATPPPRPRTPASRRRHRRSRRNSLKSALPERVGGLTSEACARPSMNPPTPRSAVSTRR